MLNVGAAIKTTTAGRMPLKMRSTTEFSLKLWKNSTNGQNDEERRKYGA